LTLTCINILGAKAVVSAVDAHHAPCPTVLCSRASWAGFVPSYLPDAVIWEFGIGGGPLTSGISEVHVGAKCTRKYPDQCYGDRVIHALG